MLVITAYVSKLIRTLNGFGSPASNQIGCSFLFLPFYRIFHAQKLPTQEATTIQDSTFYSNPINWKERVDESIRPISFLSLLKQLKLVAFQNFCKRCSSGGIEFLSTGTMHVTVRLLVLFFLGTSWVCDARELMTAGLPNREITTSDFSVLQINHQESAGEIKPSEEVVRNANCCAVCEEFIAEAIKYLDESKTQTQIFDALYKTCSLLGFFKKQCIVLVDHYLPLLFSEIESVQPSEFCQKIHLCEKMLTMSQPLPENKCEICHHTVSEFLLKLKDPETELDIIEFLMKACDAVGIHVKRCKAMVIEYGPVILANVEQLLEKTDICTAIHACDLPSVDSNQEETSPLSVL